MRCPRCQAAVPAESIFCLHCGARLAAPVPLNGGGARPAGPPPAPPPPAAAATPKQAYALAFQALTDERLRYRVARWVCEVAPAHGLAEVQAGLLRGDFATFVALTPEEAEAARRRVAGLGVHPALWRLTPAGDVDRLRPEPPPPPTARAAGWSPPQRFAAVGIGLVLLFLFGLVLHRLYGGSGF